MPNQVDKDQMADLPLKVCSLNCWGLYTSSDRLARFELIAEYLLGSDYDVVGLQEVWIRSDCKMLAKRLKSKYPFSFSFKSGVIGSGLVTFSRWPIQQAFFKRFTLSGEPHRIFHGEWFSGKGIGCCRIRLPNDRLLDFYNTHTHAQYDCEEDGYASQRLCQLQEVVDLVEFSTNKEHVVVLVGDLNTVPDSFAYKLFFKAPHCLSPNSPLIDIHMIGEIEEAGYTFNLPRNTYHSGDIPIERLDYVFMARRNFCRCQAAGVVIEDHLGADTSLSDHSPIWAQLIVSSTGDEDAECMAKDDKVKVELAREAIKILDEELVRVKKFILAAHLVAIALLGATGFISFGVIITFALGILPLGLCFGLFLLQPVLISLAVLSLFMARVYLQDHFAAVVHFRREWKLVAFSCSDENSRNDVNRVVDDFCDDLTFEQ